MIRYQTWSIEKLEEEKGKLEKKINRLRGMHKAMEAELARRALIELKQAR